MADRGKVINHLQIMHTWATFALEKDKNFFNEKHMKSIAEWTDDALALLKEHEAVEPKKVKGYKPPMYTLYEYECEECKSPMMNKQPFCMGCGKAVKWDE